MTPQKQAFLHKPEEGIFGDCFRTAIACLLDLPRDEVPHDHAAEAREYAGNDGGSQTARMNAWLAQRDLRVVHIAYPAEGFTLDQFLAWRAEETPGMHVLLSGMSRTGCGHVVIARDGKIVWDPSLTDAGIVGPQDGFWWIGFLARLT